MGLNREQIIKELEGLVNFTTCPEYIKNALSLIKELTEENERLRAENTKWQARLRSECEYTEKNTVRKMQGMFKGIVEFDIALTDDETNYLLDAIDNIAKEMIGEAND